MNTKHLVRAGVVGFSTLAVAGGAAAAVIPATAASAAPVTTMSVIRPIPPVQQQWQLNGRNEVVLTYDGSQYTYQVQFRTLLLRGPHGTKVELLTGKLTDKYEPVPLTLPLSGTISGNHVVFSVRYPSKGVDAGNQGVRTFKGTIDRHGKVTGTWSETGSEAGSGPFSLLNPAR